MDVRLTRLPKQVCVVCVALWLGTAGSQPATAVPLTPGFFALLNGANPPDGVVLANASDPFELRDDQDPSVVLSTGTVDSRVVRENGTGLLRFEYQLSVDASSPGHGEFLTVFGFDSFTTDVDFVLGGTGDVAATGGSRSDSAVSYFFPGSGTGGGVQPGETSLPLFVRSDATVFGTNGIVRVQQGLDIEDITNAFGPVIPEPASFLLFVGLAGFALGRRR